MPPAEPIREYVFTAHATTEMARRGLDEELIREVLAQPEQRLPVRPGRDVLQSRREMEGVTYLIRVFVDVDRSPPEVVTAYRTSKVDKYWRKET
ncbi:DUF4258 domain-containing protein [Pelomicrobium methylotrophicum]|uniref:DUF4258 domain-containing protein n=1 Tax=Pelomicrobium methylotrophicum TaxID=2602750 RepID=A0A5C7EQ89_9PROT|nr:DUF4258 domain-containing protein [Pelomicrobium methylotrophicum]TXF10371.1 DUF4258 domain-containing protein [Pelomicrobium methylotrophicum]